MSSARGVVTRGFRGRRAGGERSRIPPGQYQVSDFPVLSAGPTPYLRPDGWDFRLVGPDGRQLARWDWEEFRALPRETVTCDIHCVTKWSKLDMSWEGVSLDVLLEGVLPEAAYAVAFSEGDYTTNLPLADITDGQGLGRHRIRRAQPGARARWPGTAARPAPVLLEEPQVDPGPAVPRA